MKLELKPFQENAARDIMAKLDKARDSVASGDLEAIILAAPTGSGNTITLSQVIDYTFGGGDGISARPNTVFLWLSDSPELNQQSKNKLLGTCDHLPYYKMITIESENFKDDELQPGYVYFINTQLLGKDKLLTKEGGGDSAGDCLDREVEPDPGSTRRPGGAGWVLPSPRRSRGRSSRSALCPCRRAGPRVS